jgi:2-polyprenyl-3-methyl-5-hydroxy-6-metoxy-1,4-benzoquinol methylase
LARSIESDNESYRGEQVNYREQYNDYSKSRAQYYLRDKFSTVTPWGFRNHVRESVVVNLIKQIEFDSLIDIGCASGHTLFTLASIYPDSSFTGIDTGQKFIEIAKANATSNKVNNIDFECGLIEKYDYQSEFDIAILLEVIEHVIDENILMKSIKSLLVNNGVLIVSTPNLNGDGTVYGRFLRAIKLRKFTPAFDFSSEGTAEHGDQHVREFDRNSLETLMSENGFYRIELTGTLFIDFPFQELIYKIIKRIPLLLKFYVTVEIFISLKCAFLSRKFSRHLIYIGKLKDVNPAR